MVFACRSLSPELGKADSVRQHPSQLRQQPVGLRRMRFSSSTAGALRSGQPTIIQALLYNTSVFNTNLCHVVQVHWTSSRSLETWLLVTSTTSLR